MLLFDSFNGRRVIFCQFETLLLLFFELLFVGLEGLEGASPLIFHETLDIFLHTDGVFLHIFKDHCLFFLLFCFRRVFGQLLGL